MTPDTRLRIEGIVLNGLYQMTKLSKTLKWSSFFLNSLSYLLLLDQKIYILLLFNPTADDAKLDH